jgi:hypothetical protein
MARASFICRILLWENQTRMFIFFFFATTTNHTFFFCGKQSIGYSIEDGTCMIAIQHPTQASKTTLDDGRQPYKTMTEQQARHTKNAS